MRHELSTMLVVAAVGVALVSMPGDALLAQARPRSAPEPSASSEQRREKEPPRVRDREPDEPQRAQPRQPERPPQKAAPPRRPTPPPRVVPPDYHRGPHVYVFPPVSTHRGYYYHPYFGFYFGPYYGPYYPYPGPYIWPARSSASAVRTRVKPVETEVWVNGYFAGLVDDFDGVFQRLYLPSGEHQIEFHLDGFRTYRQKLYLSPGGSREVVHQMQPLSPGERALIPMTPQGVPEEWSPYDEETPTGERPASPYGIIALHVQPTDARVLVDGEVWLATADRTELVIHMPSGWHRLEVEKEGYQTFRTEIEVIEGATSRLKVELMR
jgi:hypothetical protein